MRANPPLQEMFCCKQPCPPFLLEGRSSKGHGAGRPRERAAQHPAGFGCLGRAGKTGDKARQAPTVKGAQLAQQCPPLPRETCLTFFD